MAQLYDPSMIILTFTMFHYNVILTKTMTLLLPPLTLSSKTNNSYLWNIYCAPSNDRLSTKISSFFATPITILTYG